MKRIITLAFCLYVLPGLYAQHIKYETDSKWFFGLNVGGTWNSSDVKNQTNVGWGLTFGKSFNYESGNLMSFDLRMRYLMGTWYGQDYDTTSLANYSPAYLPANLASYQTNPGYTVHNFSSTNHELGLELVLHANRLRERTGWDPYIFGGANLVWNQTHSDLVNSDSSFLLEGQYIYDPSSLNEAFINGTLDGLYETPMNAGSENLGYNLNFMPSLGIGLGYYFGPRWSFGLEHKTTFALKDDWDGVENAEPGLWGSSNDIYHYTSGYLRFHIRNGNTDVSNVNTNTNNNNLTNCNLPVVSAVRPASNGTTVDQQVYAFRTQITNISGVQNVKVRVNGVETNNFFYSTTTQLLEGSIVLNEGFNNIQVVATNACGTDVEDISINYQTCRSPIVTFLQPAHDNLNVNTAAFNVSATIANGGTIKYVVNGVQSNNFFYNANNGSFESSINLVRGVNTIMITATNDCGTDSERITINYVDCEDPMVSFLAGNGSIMTVSSDRAVIQANVSGVVDMNGIGFRVNGSNKLFSYNSTTRLLQSTINLVPGSNVIQITAGNNCGTTVEILTINYAPCLTPNVAVVVPASNGSTNTTGTQLINASVSNATQLSEIQMIVNGVQVSGGSFNLASGMYMNNAALNAGSNIIQIVVTNACGTDTETFTVQYVAPCPLPTIALASPVANTHQATLPIRYVVQNVTSASNIQMTLNGAVVTGGSYVSQSNLFSTTLNLQEGLNTIVLVASNGCGTNSETITLIYTPPCNDPSIAMVNPLGSQVSVTTSQFNIQATLQNVVNANNIQVTVNGTVDNTGTFNAGTRLYQNSLVLQQGANTVVLTVDNGCSVATQTFVINYSPCLQPSVSISAPIAGVSQNNSTLVTATILNVTDEANIQLAVNGSVYSGTFNSATGSFQSNVPLQQGVNVIQIIAGNACGSATESVSITYSPCLIPEVQIVSPQSGFTLNQTENLQALITGVASQSEITLTVNGTVVAGVYNSTTHMFTASVSLINGLNNISIQVANACGSDEATTVLRYSTPCNVPTANILTPSNGEQVDANSVQVTATVTNITSLSQIQLTMNGSVVSGGTLNNGQFSATIPFIDQQGVIVLTVTNECGSDSQSRTIKKKRVAEETMVICHHPPGNPTNTQELTIPVSAWPAHQAHGDTQGPCSSGQVDPVDPTPATMVICHHPPGNPTNTQELTIPVSAWPAHQAHGDTQGPCSPVVPVDPTPETMVICHHPPGNPTNTQELTIPVSAWPAHQAHGDTQGPCSPVVPVDPTPETMVICHHPPGNPTNTQELVIPVSAWPAHQAHGDTQGPCSSGQVDPVDPTPATMVICHHPPGNPTNTQELTIPISAWPAHQAHGDTQGPCPVTPVDSITPGVNGKMTICYTPAGASAPVQINIASSDWPSYMALGASQGPCPTDTTTSGSNNSGSGTTPGNGGTSGNGNGNGGGTTTTPGNGGASGNGNGNGGGTTTTPGNGGTSGNGNGNGGGTTTTPGNGGTSGNGNGNGGGTTTPGNGGASGNGNGNGGGTTTTPGNGGTSGNGNGNGGGTTTPGNGGTRGGGNENGNGNRSGETTEELIKKQAEELAKQKAAEEAAKRQAEELAKQKAAEEAAKKQAEELAKQKAAEEAAKKQAEELAKQKAAQEAAKKQAEELAKQKAAQEAAKKQAEELAKQKAAEEAAKKQAEELAKQKAAEEAAKKQAEELAKQQAAEEAAKKQAEELEKQKAAEAAKIKAAEEAAKKKALEEKAGEGEESEEGGEKPKRPTTEGGGGSR